MLVELEMFTQCPSKGLGQGGKPCQETGGRNSKAIPTSMAKASFFRSPQVMEGLSLATTLCLITGNLDKHLKGHNSRYHLGFWIDLGREKSLVGKTGLFKRGDSAGYGYVEGEVFLRGVTVEDMATMVGFREGRSLMAKGDQRWGFGVQRLRATKRGLK
ncbi:hypothetical protein Fmac_015212 [Flemingia macrophylla]|uniref:Uncharacterized protein n=1 Tax=Flemingia macrophylla TaxID=520843 RepID=A0ABD1MDY7_9FABA